MRHFFLYTSEVVLTFGGIELIVASIKNAAIYQDLDKKVEYCMPALLYTVAEF